MTFESVEQIFAGIDKTRRKLIERVANLSAAEADWRSAPEKWSAADIVEHLAKTEANLVRLVGKLLAQAEAENVPSTGKIEPPVSFAEIAERARGNRFEAPETLRPGGAASIADSLAELEQSRVALNALRSRLEAVDLSNAQFPHPFFGLMNLYYWLAFIGVHEAHHLRQIVEAVSLQKRTQIDAASTNQSFTG